MFILFFVFILFHVCLFLNNMIYVYFNMMIKPFQLYLRYLNIQLTTKKSFANLINKINIIIFIIFLSFFFFFL